MPGVYQITPDAGSAFFLRIDYLSHVTEEDLLSYAQVNLSLFPKDSLFGEADSNSVEEEVSPEVLEDLLQAFRAYECENEAMNYLARSEHCRFGLKQKLLKKGLDSSSLDKALDYLEEVNYLDDGRFAGAWLRSRSIDHFEGRRKLAMELASRGISKDVASKALEEFFETHDEQEICARACRKLMKSKDDVEKIKGSLMRLGFSYSQIKTALKDNGAE